MKKLKFIQVFPAKNKIATGIIIDVRILNDKTFYLVLTKDRADIVCDGVSFFHTCKAYKNHDLQADIKAKFERIKLETDLISKVEKFISENKNKEIFIPEKREKIPMCKFNFWVDGVGWTTKNKKIISIFEVNGLPFIEVNGFVIYNGWICSTWCKDTFLNQCKQFGLTAEKLEQHIELLKNKAL